jgi:heme/copper-type cytochrome/quinol oxidase subunit 4
MRIKPYERISDREFLFTLFWFGFLGACFIIAGSLLVVYNQKDRERDNTKSFWFGLGITGIVIGTGIILAMYWGKNNLL